MAIRHIRIVFWIPKATNAHSQYVLLIAFPLQPWLHEPASLSRYTYIVYFFFKLLLTSAMKVHHVYNTDSESYIFGESHGVCHSAL